jgi:hypothetical protein
LISVQISADSYLYKALEQRRRCSPAERENELHLHY